MYEIKEITLNVCISLLIGEIIYFLTPKDKIIDCVYSLIFTLIISLSIFSFVNLDYSSLVFDVDNEYQNEIDTAINDYYKLSTEIELKSMIIEALEIVNIDVSNIETIISVYDTEIIIEKIQIELKYKYDIENANTIINALFDGTIPMEVICEN